MKENQNSMFGQYISSHRKHRLWWSVVSVLSCFVVFCTVYALIYPGITMTTSCGLEEHTHTEEACYASVTPETVSLICTNESIGVHTHTEDCENEQGEPVCGYADFVVHSHDAFCFDDEGALLCTLPEIEEHAHEGSCYHTVEKQVHTHDGDCYVQTPVCQLEESESHTHDESCYEEALICELNETETETVLVCEKTEILLHTHSSDCYGGDGLLVCGQIEVPEHAHTEGCRRISVGEEEPVLTCEQEEHTHTADCTATKQDADPTEESATDPMRAADAVQGAAEVDGALVASGTCGAKVTWAYYDNGVLTISGTGDMTNYSTSSSPPWFTYLTSITKVVVEDGVTSIGSYAFNGCTGLTSVDFPDSLTGIGGYAFNGCSSLTSVDFPYNLTSIGGNAFRNCKSLTSVVFPDSLKSIGGYAFVGCTSLTSVNLSKTGLTSLGSYVFGYCYGLTSVVFPDNLKSIGESAFRDCTGLTSVDLSKTVLTSFGGLAFDGCSSLTSVYFPNSLKSISSFAFRNCKSLTSVDLSNTVLTSIGNNAFDSCGSLTSVNLSNTDLTSIGEAAFGGCKSLTSVDFPDSLKSLGGYAFSGCGSLTSVNLSNTGLTSIGAGAFYSCGSLNSVDFPENLTSIEGHAFDYCGSLTSVDFPDSLTSIKDYAFRGCRLTSVDFPDSLESIGGSAFYDCTRLTSVDFPASLKSLGGSAFQNCKSLTSVDLSKTGLTSIKDYTFQNCTGLTSVNLSNTVLESIGQYAFYDCTSLTSVYFPKSLKSIGTCAFRNCKSLTSVDLSNTDLESINSQAFNGCSRLKSVDLSKTGLKSTGASVFWQCTGLTSVVFPDNLKSIGESAFYACGSLKSVDFPDSLESIGGYAFRNCTGLASVDFPAGLKSIGSQAFRSCTNLTDVTLQAEALSTVESSAFDGCPIQTLIISDQVNEFCSDLLTEADANVVKFMGPSEFTYHGNDYAVLNGGRTVILTDDVTYFVDENGLLWKAANTFPGTDLTWSVDNGVLTISGTGDIPDFSPEDPAPWSVFASEITQVVMKDGITAIGSYAFEDYTALTEITIPESVASIGEGAFLGCSGLTEVKIENAEADIGSGAFCNCTSLGKVNDLNTLDAVMETFGLTDEGIFYNTALWLAAHKACFPATGDITTQDSTNRTITLATTQAGGTLLTGETAKTTLNVEKGEENQVDYIRVYFAFSGDGSINYSVGDYTLDNDIKISVKKSDTPNIYYVEVQPLKAGSTLNLVLNSVYEKIITGGGTLDIWPSVLSETECQTLGNGITEPTQIQRVTWITKPAEFPVTKKAATAAATVKSDGTESGSVTVNNLAYTITMTKSNQDTSYGQDHMARAEFTDRLTLPEDFTWTDGLIEAVEAGQYRWSGQYLYVTVNGESLLFCSFSSKRSDVFAWPDVETDDEGNKTLLIHWTYKNTSATEEMSNFSTTLTFGSKVIAVKDIAALSAELAENSTTSKTYTFHNEISCNQYFTYSGVQTQGSACDKNVKASAASFTIKKERDSDRVYMGGARNFTITLKNDSSFPYEALTRVTDPLSDYFYIDANQMKTLFDAERDGKLLTITISKAVLYGEAIRETVTDTNGNAYTITQQEMGKNTPHDSYVSDTAADDSYIRSSNATLTLTWAEEQDHLVLTVDAAGDGTAAEVYSIGDGCDYATIQDALDRIGYLVTCYDKYTCTWNMTEQTLYSGESRAISLPVRAKNSMMRLIGDQPWFIIDNGTYQRNVNNYAYAYYQTGLAPETYKSSSSGGMAILRDFTLYKSVSNVKDLSTPATEAETGDVLRYYIDLNYSAGSSNAVYNGAPLVDHMEGAQVLLVSAADNPDLAVWGLDTYTVNEEEYYILNQAGTYSNVKFGSFLADHVVITKIDSGIDTMIYWYLSSAMSCDVYYYALVDWEKAGLDINSADTFLFTLGNEVWLNDHQTHRLYDNVGINGTRLFVHKNIVENLPEEELNITSGLYNEHQSRADELSKRSTVHSGEQVTYRLHLDGRGTNDVVVNGSTMYDVLPASINGYWTKENVQLFYVVGEGSSATITCKGGSEWYIDTDTENNGQQSIRWEDNFKITLNGDVYIYVTLTFPGEQDWSDCVHLYGCTNLSNSFHVVQLQDEVFHDLGSTGEAVLQKGVLYTGAYNSSPFSENNYTKNSTDTALSIYANDGNYKGVATYYISLYNGGDTRLYLSEIQDVLPTGFTFLGLSKSSGTITNNGSSSGYNSLLSITDESGGAATYKTANITSTATTVEGKTRVAFRLSDGNLSYDSTLEKYYLNSGEAVVIAYHCATNRHSNSEDVADNYAAMPIYDYNGYGVAVDQDTVIDRAALNHQISNNGSCGMYDNQQMKLLGMDTSSTDNFTKWLASDVRLYRGTIVPGITKTAEKSFSNVTEPVSWTVTVTNSGTDTMYAYTLTDVMMAPYQFTGNVTYSIAKTGSTAAACKLFTFGERTDTSVTITSKIKSVKLDLTTGEAKAIPTYFPEENSTITPLVSLKKDGAGNEILTIRFVEEDYKSTGLAANCSGTLKLTTINVSGSMSNKTYVNTAYITPVQDYEKLMVTQGSNTLLDGNPSVVSEANVAVSYGYATSSVKSVEESNNTAQSFSSTNYIVLSDKGNTFRYDLTVNNTGGSTTSQAMDLLVLIDNLPEVNDHSTFYEEIGRQSEFAVMFAEDPQVTVSVDNVALTKDKYTVEYSTATTFTDDDWAGSNESTTAWSDECNDTMRSIRVIIKDETGVTIPPNAVITVSFNAKITSPENALPSQYAWNSFGYHYSLVNNDTELEATPSKVGVKIASIPMLTKKLINSNGDAYPAVADETFRFLIYRGKAQNLNGYKAEAVAEILQNQNIPFTVVDLTVNKDMTESDTVVLDHLHFWEVNADGELAETSTAWSWDNLESYSIVELEQKDSIYVFGAFNNVRPNNYTFIYQSAFPMNLSGTNVRNVWSLLLHKQGSQNKKLLSGAVFGLYSKLETDQISEDAYAALREDYGVSPDRTVNTTTESGEIITWFLKDVQTSNEYGEILWSDLTEEEYYLLELRAPDGYKLNSDGQIVEPPASGTGTKDLTVENISGYKLPQSGGMGTTGFYVFGILLVAAAVILPIPMGRRERKRAK